MAAVKVVIDGAEHDWWCCLNAGPFRQSCEGVDNCTCGAIQRHSLWCGHCKCFWYSFHVELVCPLCKQSDRFVGILQWTLDGAWVGDPFPLAEFLGSV